MMVSLVPNGLILHLKISAAWLALVWLAVVFGNWSPAVAQVEAPKRFDLRIERRLSVDLKVIRVRRGDAVEINWSANRRTVLHLHGYDIETVVEVGRPQTTSFTARATGHLPIRTHGQFPQVFRFISKCIRGSR